MKDYQPQRHGDTEKTFHRRDAETRSETLAGKYHPLSPFSKGGANIPLFSKEGSGEIWLILLILICFPFSASASSDKGKADYWTGKYREVKEGTLYSKASEVFNRVLASADRRKGVEPRLYIINYSGLPWAQSLEDGSIILTRRAVEFCYHDKDKEAGDARLAFVVGHELAHQFNGDFWPYRFAASTGNNPEFSGIKESARSPEVIKTIELEADQYGAIYAALAGFRMDVVVSRDVNFFEEWSRASYTAITGLCPDNPSVNQRAKAVTARLKEVSSRLELFHMGVIASGLGWYRESVGLFEEFLRYYPGREVYNNVGAAYLGRAMRNYREWKGNSGLPFYLSTETDPVTRADSIEVGRSEESRSSGDFKVNLDKAIEYFTKASDSDPYYAIAKSNLGAAYILDEKYHKALSELDDAVKLNAKDAGIINNRAIAYFLLGSSLTDSGLKERAIKDWENIASGACSGAFSKNMKIARRMTGKIDDMSFVEPGVRDSQDIPDIGLSTTVGREFDPAGFSKAVEVKTGQGSVLSVYAGDRETVLVKDGIAKIVSVKADKLNLKDGRRGCDDLGIVFNGRKGMDMRNNTVFVYQK